VEQGKAQIQGSPGRAVLADFSVVFFKALASGVAVSVLAAGFVLALARLGG
jgi:hypothetical protein